MHVFKFVRIIGDNVLDKWERIIPCNLKSSHVRYIKKSRIISCPVVFIDDGIVLEGHDIVMERYHFCMKLEVDIIKRRFLHDYETSLFIVIFVTAGRFEMEEIIVFIIRVE